MIVLLLLAGRLTGLEERCHGTWFGNRLAYGAMAKAFVPVSSSRGREEERESELALPHSVKLLRSLSGR